MGVGGGRLFLLGLQFFCCAPVAHGDAYGRGSSHCISWYQKQFILTTCFVCYRIAVWDNCSTGQLWSLIPRDFSSAFW